MRNAAFRKFIVYTMIGIMLLSSLLMGLSFVI
ncbi:stressosome-associated protein Prli42 [Planococcus sp. ISL-110]|nr:stressosome-associated protein Prli42 [Planococcus sp. ISL-110]MBT2571668.1 stressosome-associated protein Prli42 [Planococcus sp. ISL-110]